jgi:hypothetical protein
MSLSRVPLAYIHYTQFVVSLSFNLYIVPYRAWSSVRLPDSYNTPCSSMVDSYSYFVTELCMLWKQMFVRCHSNNAVSKSHILIMMASFYVDSVRREFPLLRGIVTLELSYVMFTEAP